MGPKPTSTFEKLLDEAEKVQQRAERRQNIQYYEEAAELFRRALSAARSSPIGNEGRIADCYFGLAETLQNLAETLTAAVNAGATLAGERQTAARACQLYEEAVDNYANVLEDGSMRSDAAVNCANALAAWAGETVDASPPGALNKAATLLGQAEEYYNVALSRESDDAATLCNLADVFIQHGDVCHQAGHPDQAWELCARGREAYTRACSVCSSERGDSLPGLLLNWGSGLLKAAGWAPTATLQMSMLDEAICRFRHSISFDRGDVAPHNALGDALVAKAECLMNNGGAGATELLHAALTEGYGGALRIRSTDADALVGTAEVHMQLAKEGIAKANESAAAFQHWMAAKNAFTVALSRPETLTSLREREEVRYNYVCCLAGGGWIVEAAEELRSLMESGVVNPEDVATDPDLAPLRSSIL